MSGGYIGEQASGDHQVVMFTFSGKITKEQKDAWNACVRNFKSKTFKVTELAGVTIRGDSTPAEFRAKKASRK